MNFYSETSLFNISINTPEFAQDLNNVEESAAKALKNIHLIYNEVMSPKENRSEEFDLVNYNVEDNSSYRFNQQNHYVKSCCNALQELCIKCDRYIAQCSSCNRCTCNKSNKHSENIASVKNYKNSRRNQCSQNYGNIEVKCTIPKPFSLYAKCEEQQKVKELKISKIRQELESKIENELKIRANCKPVPKSTHLPLYNQMIQEKEKRKNERKQKCLDILNDAKPFNLHSGNTVEKVKSSSDLPSKNAFNFKAKPAPKHILSNKISEKLKNKEEVRKMLIRERAQQTKEQSSLPFSTKPVIYSRSLIDLYNLDKSKSKEPSKPKNISEITKRLYIKKCNETMDNWNEKVLQVESHKKINNMELQHLLNEHISSTKKNSNKAEELPFMYFPVRMSNAAILREKQIRTEILARKEREKRIKEDELSKKKTNIDILHKLRTLIPVSDGEKEIDEKVKSFRESQIRRKHEYEKELEEIMKRVSEQNLLLERQTKGNCLQSSKNDEKESKSSDEEIESDEEASESDKNTNEYDINEQQKSFVSNSSSDDSSHES